MDEPEFIASIRIVGAVKSGQSDCGRKINSKDQMAQLEEIRKIIQELEGLYRGAGWTVIKVLWSSGWDRIMNEDSMGVALSRIEAPTMATGRGWYFSLQNSERNSSLAMI